MTYNAVENYLRKFRKDAKEMKGEAADRAGPVPSPARSRTKKAATVSPSKANAGTRSWISSRPFQTTTLLITKGVKSGRVAKKKAPAKVKTEVFETEVEGAGDNMDLLGDDEEV
jgi:hypothetical protein